MAEQRVGIPDFGVAGPNQPTGNKTAKNTEREKVGLMLMEHRQPARCRRTLRMWSTSEFKKRVLYLYAASAHCLGHAEKSSRSPARAVQKTRRGH
jgi:hypothetical protein